MTWLHLHATLLLDIALVAGAACLLWLLARSYARHRTRARALALLAPALAAATGGTARVLALLSPGGAGTLPEPPWAWGMTLAALAFAGVGLAGLAARPPHADTAPHTRGKDLRAVLQALIGHFADGVCVADARGRYVLVNDAFARLSGYSRSELEGLDVHTLLPPGATALLPPAAREGNSKRHEYRLRRKDGSLIDTEATGSPFELDGRHLAIGVVRDISQRKRDERALAESWRSLQLALDTGSVGTFDWNLQSNLAECSSSYLKLLGLPPETGTLTRDTFLACVHADDRVRVRRELRRVLTERQPLETEFRVVWPDGSVHWLFGRAQAIADEHNAVAHRVVGAQTDITAHKLAEQRLAKSETLFRALIEQSQDGIILTTADGTLVQANPAIVHMTGYTTVALQGANVRAFLPEEAAASLHATANAGQPAWREARLKRKDGGTFEAGISTSPIDIGGDRLILHVIRDVSERHAMETALRMRSEALEHSLNGVSIVDEHGDLVYVNDAYVRMWGYDAAEELLGAGRAGHYADPREAERILSSLRTSGEDVRHFTARRRDGSTFEVLAASRRHRTGDGRELFVGTSLDVTERVRAERALRESETLLRQAFEHLPLEFWVKDLSDRVIMQNPLCQQSWGDLTGKRLEDTALPAHVREAWQSRDRIVRSGQPVTREQRYARDGAEVDYLEATVPLRDASGSVTKILGVAIDITARTQAQASLRKSEQRFRDFAEAAADWFWEQGPDLRLTYLSERIDLLGISSEDLLGRRREEYSDHSDVTSPQWRQHFATLQAREPFHDFEFSWRDNAGNERILSISGKPVFDSDGNFCGYRGAGRDVTRERRIQAALRESEARLQAAFDHLPFEFYLMDIDGRYLMQNPASRARWGDIVGRTDAELEVPKRTRATWQRLDALALGGETVQEEIRYDIAGQHYDCLDIVVPLRDERGNITSLLGVGIDITEQNRAQAAVRESEARLQAAFDHLPYEFWMMGADGRYVMQNPSCRARWGDWLGLTTAELDVPDSVREQWLTHDALAPLGQPVCEELRYEIGDAHFDYLETMVPICNDAGEVTSVLGVGVDITERKRMEISLRESEQRFRDFADIAADTFWEQDASLRYRYLSPRHQAVTGRPDSDFLGRTRREIYAGHEPVQQWEQHFQDLEAHRPYTFEFETDAAGQTVVVQNVGRPIYAEEGRFLGYRGVGRNITERRRAEQALQRLLDENRALAQTLLQTEEAERKRLAGELHDELGQALTAIQIEAENVASASGPGMDAIRGSAESIRAAAARVYAVAHGMMERLRPAILEDLGLIAALRELVADWRTHHRDVTLEFASQGKFDDLDEPTRITAYRIVQEALTNVAKHADASEVRVTLVRRNHRDGDSVELQVQDDGVGTDLTAPMRGGAMGLPGMRERALAIGGSLELHSIPGAGLRLTAQLPVASERSAALA